MITITQREDQVWNMYVQGMAKKEIAAKLNRSFHTINQITRNLYEKLQITKETELIREWFIHHAIITRDELKRAIAHKSAPLIALFIVITAFQIVFETPAVRVMRPGRTVSRSANRSNSGRRKDYEL